MFMDFLFDIFRNMVAMFAAIMPLDLRPTQIGWNTGFIPQPMTNVMYWLGYYIDSNPIWVFLQILGAAMLGLIVYKGAQILFKIVLAVIP